MALGGKGFGNTTVKLDQDWARSREPRRTRAFCMSRTADVSQFFTRTVSWFSSVIQVHGFYWSLAEESANSVHDSMIFIDILCCSRSIWKHHTSFEDHNHHDPCDEYTSCYVNISSLSTYIRMTKCRCKRRWSVGEEKELNKNHSNGYGKYIFWRLHETTSCMAHPGSMDSLCWWLANLQSSSASGVAVLPPRYQFHRLSV